MIVEWKPREEDLRDHVPFCFVAETSNLYQSEMRCVIVMVETNIIVPNVTCHENTMTVIIPKTPNNELFEHNFRLNDPQCLVSSDLTHLIASVGYNSCGTETVETDTHIVFRNRMTSFDDINGVITRKHNIVITFNCSFPKNSRLSASFHPQKLLYEFEEAGFGNFAYKFQFYADDRFVALVTDFPVDVVLRELLYMEIQVSSTVPNVQLFVESCKATPHDDSNDPVFYDIIKNGCEKDDTLVVYPGTRTQYRFSLEAFAFIGHYEEVYISCTVILCKDDDLNARCYKGCITDGYRRRRSLASESQQHFISQGPLRMKRQSPSNAVEITSLNMNTLVIALSAVVIVALVAVIAHTYMKRARTTGYERLQTEDF
ncbi:ZP domain-containing protein-like isoform X2 [Mixophyes fleayi]